MTTAKFYLNTIKNKIKIGKRLGNYTTDKDGLNHIILKYFGTSIIKYEPISKRLWCCYDYSISTKCMITKIKRYLREHLEITEIITYTKTNRILSIEHIL